MSDVVGSAQVLIEPAGLAAFERELERGVSAALDKLEGQFEDINKTIQKSTDSAKKLSKEIPGQLNIGDIGNISEQLSFGDLGGEVAEGFAAVTGEASEAIAGVAGEAAETVAGVSGEVAETLTATLGELSETIAGVSGEIAETLAGVGGESAETAAAVGGVGRAFRTIGPLLATIGIGAYFRNAAQEASILQESTTKVQAVFGEFAPQINEFASTAAESFAVAESSALGAAGTFGNLFTALGVSTEVAATLSPNLVALSADLASFNDLAGGSEEALISLRAAVTGEFEPLRRLGVALTDVAVRNRAVELGLADTAVSASVQSRILARYDLILEQTANQQNDFARTSQFLANQQRSLSAEFKTLTANVGSALQPVLLTLIGVARDLLPSFEVVASTAAELAGVFVTALAPVLDALGPAFEQLSGGLATLAQQLGPTLTNIGEAFGAVLAELAVKFGELLVELSPTLVNLGDLAVVILDALGPALGLILDLVSSLPDWFFQLVAVSFALNKAFGGLAAAASRVATGVANLFTQFANGAGVFSAAGGAALGLGAAIAIGVTAYSAATSAARDLDRQVEELTDNLLEATETAKSTFDAVSDFVELKFGEDVGAEALEQLNLLGVGVDDVVSSIESGGDAIEPVREALRGLGLDIAEAAPKSEVTQSLLGFQAELRRIGNFIDEGKLDAAARTFAELGVSIPDGANASDLSDALAGLTPIAELNASAIGEALNATEDYDDGAQRAAKAALEQLQFLGEITEERKNDAIATATLAGEETNYAAALQTVDAELYEVIQQTEEAGAVTFDYTTDITGLIQSMQSQARAGEELTESLGELTSTLFDSIDAQEVANSKVAEQKAAIDAQVESIERQKQALEDSAAAQKEAIDTQIKAIERQKKATQRIADDRKDAINAQIKGLQDQKKALQDAAKVEEKARKEQAEAIEKLNEERKKEVDELQKLEDEARRAFSGFVNAADAIDDVLTDLPKNAEISLKSFRETIEDNLGATTFFIFGIRTLLARGADDLANFFLSQGEGAQDALTEAISLNKAQLDEQEKFIEDFGGYNDDQLDEVERLVDELDGVDVPTFDPIEVPEVEIDISDAVDKFDEQIDKLQDAADSIDIDLDAAVDNFDAQIDRLRQSAERIDISESVARFDAQIEQLRQSADVDPEDIVPTFDDFIAAQAEQLGKTQTFIAGLEVLYAAGANNLAAFYAEQGLTAAGAVAETAAQDETEILRREGVFNRQQQQLSDLNASTAIFALEARLAGELFGSGLPKGFLQGFDPNVIAGAYAALQSEAVTETELLNLLVKNKLGELSGQTGISAQEIADAWGLKFDLTDPTFDELESVEDAIFGKQDDTDSASGELSSTASRRFRNEFQWAAPTNAELGRTARQIELDQRIGSASTTAGEKGRDRFGRGLRLDQETSRRINDARQAFTPVINGNSLINRDAEAAGASTGGNFVGGLAGELNAAGQPGGSAYNAMTGLVDNLEGAARDAAEAQSPSRLFARLGDDIAAGAAMGIKDGINSRSGGLFDALSEEFRNVGTLSADLDATIGASTIGFDQATLPSLARTGAGAAAAAVAPVRIEQNVTVQPPLGMSDTEAERIGTLIAQNARTNVVNSVRTGGRTSRGRG